MHDRDSAFCQTNFCHEASRIYSPGKKRPGSTPASVSPCASISRLELPGYEIDLRPNLDTVWRADRYNLSPSREVVRRSMKNNWKSVVCLAVLISVARAPGVAWADSQSRIRFVCTKKFPKEPDEQRKCQGLQNAAATKLMMAIEGVSETSLEFAVANSCIERAKVRQPATIDWSKALACFQSRYAGTKPIEDS
jgi:hypothetical protein